MPTLLYAAPTGSQRQKARRLWECVREQIGLEFDGTKQMKIPTGYYDNPASLGKYLQKEFAMNLPINGHEELSACQIHSS